MRTRQSMVAVRRLGSLASWTRTRSSALQVAMVLGLSTVTCFPGYAANLVFFDGFESGSICAWAGECPAPASGNGTWRFTLDFDGQPRELVVVLHQRAAGDLVGYLLGGTPKRVVTGGTYSASTLTLDLLFERPLGDRALHLVATVAGDIATGTVTGDLGTQAVSMFRWSEVLEERRWIVADLDTPVGFGTITGAHLAVVLRPNGEFLTGGYAAAEMAGCLWNCDGGITTFSEIGSTVTFGLETDGGCSAGSAATLNSDTVEPETGAWLGSTTFTDCSGTVSGPIVGAPSTGTRSDDAAELLAAVTGVADQLQSGSPFTAPHPSFAVDFFHEGLDLSETLAELNAEIAAWDDIEVSLSRVRRISTLDLPGVPPIASRPRGIELEESRSGIPVGGGAREIYLDPARNPFDDIHDNPLAVAGLTGAGWQLAGDHQTAFDLPLLTEPVGPTDTTLHMNTPGGTVYVSLGPFGSHFSPLTGHVYGDGKPNLAGFLVSGETELDELLGDGSGDDDGACEAGEACAYWGELDGSLVRNRVPTYVAPHDAEVESIVFYSAPTGVYFDDPPQWRITLRFPSNVESKLDHIGSFAAGFAEAVATATGCDPRAWMACGLSPGDDLLSALSPMMVSAGEALAQPQVLATEVVGYPGYYTGGGGFLEFPWAQLEFNTELPVELKAEGCPYLLLSDARRAELSGVMERDMLDPTSMRYRDRETQLRWKWAAEATLCTSPTSLPGDYRSLLTSLGGWYERSDAGTTPDEVLSFARIDFESTVFPTAGLDPATQLLLLRQRQYGLSFLWTMPDASVVEAYYPGGEVRELDDDSFLVEWRDLNWAAGNPPAYQRATYRLDEEGLAVRWGAFAVDAASAVLPPPPDAVCDELETLCYSHQGLAGF